MLNRKILIIITLLLLFTLNLSAQIKPRKIDEMGQLGCEEIKLKLDFLAIEMQNNPTDKAFIIFYGGKTSLRYKYNKKTQKYETKNVRPKRSEAIIRMIGWDNYLTSRKIDKSRFQIINGGYRENFTVEFWLAPIDGETPVPSPTFNEKDIKFGKGGSRGFFNSTDC